MVGATRAGAGDVLRADSGGCKDLSGAAGSAKVFILCGLD